MWQSVTYVRAVSLGCAEDVVAACVCGSCTAAGGVTVAAFANAGGGLVFVKSAGLVR